MSYEDKICHVAPQRQEYHSNSIPTPILVNYDIKCQTNDCNCDPIYSYQPENIAPCSVSPMGYVENSIPVQYNSAKYGISDPSNGLNQSFLVGLGLESRVRYDSLSVETQYNLIPWYWNDYSAFDPSLPFTPKKWDYEGFSFETPERNRLIVKDCNGIVIKDITAPTFGGSGGGFSVRITDTQPLTDATIPVTPGQTLQITAGEGIDLNPINGGFRISNSAPSAVLAIQAAPNSGIIISGGSNGVPYTVGIDCGTLRSNCNLVRSVNGNLPDSNGNVTISASAGQGISAITTPDNTIVVEYPTAGIAALTINCANLRAKCNFITATNVGTAGQFLRNNGNNTATWVDLPGGGGSGGGGGSSSIVAPSNFRAGQSVANGGNIDGSTIYACGDPLLSWTASLTSGVTYEVSRNGLILATGLTGTTYQTTSQVQGLSTYAVVAKTSSANSSSVPLSVSVVACGIVSTNGFYGIHQGTSTGPYLAKLASTGTTTLWETALSTGSNSPFFNSTGGVYNTVAQRIYVALQYVNNTVPAVMVNADPVTGAIGTNFDLGTNVLSNPLALPNGDIVIATRPTGVSSSVWTLKVYSNLGVLKNSYALNASITVQGQARIALDLTGTIVYFAVSSGGGVQAFDLTSGTSIWSKIPSGITDLYANVVDIQTTKTAPNRLFINGNNYDTSKLAYELNIANGNTVGSITSANQLIALNIAITPDGQNLFTTTYSPSTNQWGSTSKINTQNNSVSYLSNVYQPTKNEGAIVVSKDGSEFAVAYNAYNSTTIDAIRVYSTSNGTYLRSYKPDISYNITQFIL